MIQVKIKLTFVWITDLLDGEDDMGEEGEDEGYWLWASLEEGLGR